MSTVAVLLPMLALPLWSQADSHASKLHPPLPNQGPLSLPAQPDVGHRPRGYQMSAVYDQVAHQTRLTVVPFRKSRSLDHATVSYAVSATVSGGGPAQAPDSVEFLFTAFAPSRSGWALAHPVPLRVLVEDSLVEEIPSSGYQRLSVALTARGRSEIIVFRVAWSRLLELADLTDGRFKVGRFVVPIDQNGRDGLRALAARFEPAHP